MEFTRETLRLYAVTDRSWLGDQTLSEQVEAALKGGVTCVQLREKELNEADFLAEAMEIKEICHRYGVPLLINDNVQIALKSGADGVHLGQSDGDPAEARKILGEKAVIGVSARSVAQAKDAEEAGASYLGTGAVFGTSTKKDARPLDKETLKAVCNAVSIPVVAIGGIHKGNIEKLAGTGIAGVALVSAIFSAENIEEECRVLRALSEKTAK